MTIEEDPIVAEVREARRRISAFYGNDIQAVVQFFWVQREFDWNGGCPRGG